MKKILSLLSFSVLLLAAACQTPNVNDGMEGMGGSEHMDHDEMDHDDMDHDEDDMHDHDGEEAMDDKTKGEDVAMEKAPEEKAPEKKKSKVVSSGRYTAYVDGVVGNGDPAVLFFHATWCPKCQANDAKLQLFYSQGLGDISTYKIDYDASTELRKQFGVVQQDTFVRIDGEGNSLQSISFPSESALKELIAS